MHRRSNMPDAIRVTDGVQLVWYPRSRFSSLFSHLELAVDGTLWAADLKLTQEGRLENRKFASQMGGRGFFVFSIQVSKSEFLKLRRDLAEAEGIRRLHTCASGACDFLSRQGINIPFPFSTSPALTAIYLTIAKYSGSNRISKIEWIGQRHWRQFMTAQPAVELALTYKGVQYFYALVVTLIDKSGNVIKAVVPLAVQFSP